ncbi:MAG: O-antigen ligase family protein, partial [Anaerolineales bacterium]|nr:O-antigen ligase family protein [Anaerolineales bacterium]
MIRQDRDTIQYLAAVCFFLFFLVGYSTPQPTLRTVAVVVAASALAAWIVRRMRSRRPILWPRPAIPIVVFVAWCFLLVWKSPLPLAGLERALTALVLVTGFLIVSDGLSGGWKPRIWENALFTFGVVFVVLELALWAVWYVNWWRGSGVWLSAPPIGYRATGLVLGHPNVLAGFLCIILPLILGRVLDADRRRRIAGWTALGILLLAGLYLTSSRSGWLACLAGLGATFLLSYGRRLVPRSRSLRSLAGGALIVLTTVVLVVAGMIYLLQRSQLTPGHASLQSPRAQIWRPALQIIASSPLAGHGIGSFPVLFAVQTGIPPGFATSHAHNALLQVAAETGFIGVLVVLWASVEVVRALLHAWPGPSRSDRIMLSAYIGGLLAASLHHVADFLFESAVYTAAFLVVLALVLRYLTGRDRFTVSRTLAMAGSLIALALYVVGSALVLRGGQIYWRGVASGRAGQWQVAATELCSAARTQPQNTLYSFQCGLALANLASSSGDLEALESAISIYRSALEMDPAWPVHWANLAALEWSSGRKTDAIAHMGVASEAAPGNAVLALNLGLYQEAASNDDAAVAAYRKAIQADPWLALRLGVVGSRGWNAALLAEADHLAGIGALSPTYAAWAELSSDPDGALSLFRDATRAEPMSAMAHAGLSIAEQEAGNSVAATEHMRVALALGGNDPTVVDAAGRLARLQGNEALATERI